MKKGDELAFPTMVEGMVKQEGLTKREYFAGQAIAGICADNSHNYSLKRCAEIATQIADALIVQLDSI